MRTIEQMVQQEINCCLSSLVSTLAGGYGAIENSGRAHSRGESQRPLAELSDLCEQAFELASPIPDYEEAAIQAGWLVKQGLWFNERFDGVAAAKADGADVYESAREVCEGEQIDPYAREVYEHWAVSNWFAEKLQQQGEKVDTDFAGLNVWARTTTGQQISADGVIERIYAKMMEPA